MKIRKNENNLIIESEAPKLVLTFSNIVKRKKELSKLSVKHTNYTDLASKQALTISQSMTKNFLKKRKKN
jgi:hypothetical protein